MSVSKPQNEMKNYCYRHRINSFFNQSLSKSIKGVEWLLAFVTAERALMVAPNGGAVVFLRSLWSSFLLYCIGVWILSSTEHLPTFTDPLEQVKIVIHESIGWFGAIFAAIYVALYTRFSSQWTYLTNLYNEQMNAGLLRDDSGFHQRTYDRWRAAFIEDAIKMGLDKKDGISTLVYYLLREPGICDALNDEPILEPGGVNEYKKWFYAKFADIEAKLLAEENEYSDMIEAVRAFLSVHNARFQWWHRVNDDHAPNVLNRAGFKKRISASGKAIETHQDEFREHGDKVGAEDNQAITLEYYVLPGVFRDEVCKGFDSRAVATLLYDKGYLEAGEVAPGGGRPRLDKKVRLPGLGLTRCYVIKPEVFGQE